MARPASIRDEDLIAAAREVFLAHGLHATTAEVAERAGVSEGTLFKRFGSKFELFRAAMQLDQEDGGGGFDWLQALARDAGKPNLRARLVEIGVRGVHFFEMLTPLIMMAWSNQSQAGLPAELCKPSSPPLRAMELAAKGFAAEMDAGHVRRCNPDLLARMFLGSLHNYVFFSLLSRILKRPVASPDEYVRQMVDVLWTGVAPARSRRS